MELSEEIRRAIRDLDDGATLAKSLTEQARDAGSRVEAAASLLGLIGQAAALRDEAADLYITVTESGGEA